MSQNKLSGLRVLVLEDEYLIAMDVELLCRDHGADDVVICRSLAELGDGNSAAPDFDVAILDIMLDGKSTVPFAEQLRDLRVPFVFASGYGERGELTAAFPGVLVVAKPYSGSDLVNAVSKAFQERALGESR